MKLQPFNLELWLHLGKSDCVWARCGAKIIELHYHENAFKDGYCLSGLVEGGERGKGSLEIWTSNGESQHVRYMARIQKGQFSPLDLMLHLEEKPISLRRKK